MQCPSCGSLQEMGVEHCPVCGAFSSGHETLSGGLDMAQTPAVASNGAQNHPSTSKLIEFPGVSRSSLPQWRKELSERVREVHEKRAREAALEAAEQGPRDPNHAANVAPLLELLPQADVAPLNPIVTAALRRIERAHHAAAQGGNRLVSTPGGASQWSAVDSARTARRMTGGNTTRRGWSFVAWRMGSSVESARGGAGGGPCGPVDAAPQAELSHSQAQLS